MKTSIALLILVVGIAVANVVLDRQLNSNHPQTRVQPVEWMHSSMNTCNTTEEIWISINCRTLQNAVEAFANANDGAYPDDVDMDETTTGETVIDLLPGGRRLKNPFTGMASEPVNGHAANPGQIGYMALGDGRGNNTSYRITGWGQDSLLVEITKR